MRRKSNLPMRVEPVACRQRLRVNAVEGSQTHSAAIKGAAKCVLVHESTSCDVHQMYPVLHHAEGLVVQEMVCGLRLGRRHDHVISIREKFIETGNDLHARHGTLGLRPSVAAD